MKRKDVWVEVVVVVVVVEKGKEKATEFGW